QSTSLIFRTPALRASKRLPWRGLQPGSPTPLLRQPPITRRFLLTVRNMRLVISNRLPIVPAGQAAQGLEIDAYRQHVHAAVTEDELTDAGVVAAEHRQFADLIKRG